MGIVSVSMDAAMESSLGKAMKVCGVKSRSKLVRMAISSLLKEYLQLDELSGIHTAVFTVTYAHESFDLNRVLHDYSEVVKLNTHFDSRKGCAAILLVEGDSEKIRSLFRRIRAYKQVSNVTISIA